MPYANFERFEFRMSLADATNCSHSGACDDNVAHVLTKPYIRKQLAAIPDGSLRDELREYGAWDSGELDNRAANEARMVWIAAGNIKEERKC